MKDELITFKTAKLAKEKGFDFSNVEIRDSNTLEVADNVKARLDYFETMKESNLVQLPTQSLLQRWLREKHEIMVEIQLNEGEVDTTYKWLLFTRRLTGKGLFWISGDSNEVIFNTYEEALEVGLQESLKLIKI